MKGSTFHASFASYIARFLLCPQLSRNLARYRCKVSPRVKNSLRNFLAAFSLDFDRLATLCGEISTCGRGVSALQSGYEKGRSRGGSNASVEVCPRNDGLEAQSRKGRVLFARCYLNPRERIALGTEQTESANARLDNLREGVRDPSKKKTR